MTRHMLGCFVTLTFVLVVPLTAQAPPAGNIWRLGYLAPTPPAAGVPLGRAAGGVLASLAGVGLRGRPQPHR